MDFDKLNDLLESVTVSAAQVQKDAVRCAMGHESDVLKRRYIRAMLINARFIVSMLEAADREVRG
jgi:trans-aconitate methyltransferase